MGGSKDIIDPIIENLLFNFNKDKIQFILNLVGITDKELNLKFGIRDWKSIGINALGRLSHDETEKIVSKSDFSILLRQNKRYAKAGFSTKFAESMSNGIPVICTKVGGADVLVEHMKNGILIENNDNETIENIFKSILQLSNKEITTMKENAYESALKYFDYKAYKESMQAFIEKS